MGTNRRCADRVDEQMNERIEQRVNPPVIAASTAEHLDKSNATLRRFQPLIPVRAWSQFSDQTAVEVNDALAVACASKRAPTSSTSSRISPCAEKDNCTTSESAATALAKPS